MNFGKSFWVKAIIGICIVFVIIFVMQSFMQKAPSPSPFSYATPTPVQLPQTYTNANQNLTMQYPRDWSVQPNDNPQDQTTTFTFTESGQQYLFVTLPPGQGFGEASLMKADMLATTTVQYGGRNFLRKLWSFQGKPVLIQVIPNEQGFLYNSFSMKLPPANTEKYIHIFDQIMNSLQIPAASQNIPQPTIEGSTIIYIPTSAPEQ